jgi:hypothetical protein
MVVSTEQALAPSSKAALRKNGLGSGRTYHSAHAALDLQTEEADPGRARRASAGTTRRREGQARGRA